jgi:putative DNA primase/helicase
LQEINTLTAESILEDDIFCEIMEQEDEIYKARLILTLEDKADSLGVKIKFGKLLSAYKKVKAKYDKENKEVALQSPDSLERMTEFNSSKHDEMKCGNWIANGNGVRTFGPFGGEILACYHPILPVQRLINAETKKEKIKLAYKKGKRWDEIVVDKEVIANSNKITALSGYGISVTSENSRNLVRFLSDVENFNIDRIGTQISTSKLGWINKEFMPYGHNVIFDSETKFRDTYNSIAETGSEDAWMSLAKKVRKSKRFEPKIYLMGSLSSALIEPLNALPFILNLWGVTGKGKTVAIMFATSVWANPYGNDYVGDPKATVTALELKLDFLNNFPLMLDDMAQLKNRYGGDFSELVYMLCSGKGKDRANANLGINKSTSWKNSILTNGEHSLVNETMQGGAINRIIDVEMAEGYVFPNGNEVVEILKQNYGFCGRKFIDIITEIGMERIKEWQRDFLTDINKRAAELGVEKEEKQSLPMSILLTTDKIATEYIFEDNQYLDFNYCVDLLKNKGEVSENERAYEFIMSEVAINMNKFKPDIHGDYKGEMWGAIEDGYVIILKNAFNRISERGNFSSKSFLSWADKKCLIDTAKNRKDKQKRLDGSLSWCYFLKIQDDSVDKDGFVQIPESEQGKLPFQ